MATWWMSFCDPNRPAGQQFLGACLVDAADLPSAITAAWLLQCNPGGEIAAWPIEEHGRSDAFLTWLDDLPRGILWSKEEALAITFEE